jgi:DNA polymerase-3 subunit gamma/tau
MPDNSGQLKKKPDTPASVTAQHDGEVKNQVAVLSDAPAVYTTNKATATPLPAVTVVEPTLVAEEKPKVFIPNASTTSIKIPSLKGLDNAVETVEEDDPYLKGDSKQPFDAEQLLHYWRMYAEKAKAEGKATLSTIFAGKPNMLSATLYEVVVETKAQEAALRDEKPNLLNFLRTSLKNFDLDIVSRIDEIKVNRKPYGAKETYQYMAAKNPQLAELRKMFNLDFD